MAVAASSLNWRDKIIATIYKMLFTGQLRIGNTIFSLSSIVKISAITLLSLYTTYKFLSFCIDQRIKNNTLRKRYRIPLQELLHESVKGVMMADGRWLAYCEFGALDSPNVVFYCHTLGSSRLEHHPQHDSIARELNIRFIHIDRPGYGQSSVHDNRTYISFANDIREVAKALKIERYAVLGVASGAPYALACAYQQSEQQNEKIEKNQGLVCAVALSSDLPYKDLPPSEYSPFLKDFHFLTKYLPFLLRFFMNAELHNTVFSNPEQYTQSILRDEATLYEHEGDDLKTYLSLCVEFLREGMNAYGIEEPFREIKMERTDWQFKLENITNVPIIFWHGTRNKLIPIRLVRKVVESMRHVGSLVELHEIPKKGHYFWMNNEIWRDILVNMLQHFYSHDHINI